MNKTVATFEVVAVAAKVVAIAALFCSVTNFVYASVAFSALSLALCPFLIPAGLASNKRFKFILLYFLFFVSSVALYDISSLANLDFYRRDGNTLVSFAPLLTLFLARDSQGLRWNSESIVKNFLFFAAAINIPLFAWWLYSQQNLHPEYLVIEDDYFHSLFFATNAAGGFFAVVLCFCAAAWLSGKSGAQKVLNFGLLALFTVLLFATGSRGSLVGAVGAFVLFFIFKKYRHQFYKVTSLGIAASLLLTSFSLLTLTPQQVAKLDEDLFYDTLRFDSDVSSKEANWLLRVQVIWPRALSLFLESPVVGIGVGGYDDRPVELDTLIPGLLAINRPQTFLHTDAHAHNSFLHIMAESGLVGLVLFLVLLSNILKEVLTVNSKFLQNGLLLSFWTLTFASLSEHRWVSPSNSLPFFLILFIALSFGNTTSGREGDSAEPTEDSLAPPLPSS
jgi:O-antigen ligase